MSYELVCPCGQTLRGARQRRHQAVPCPGCGAVRFVLPASPRRPGEPAPRRAAPSWRMPIVAAGVSVALLVAGFAVAWPLLMRSPASSRREARADGDRTDSGRQALRRARFRLAHAELEAALAERVRRGSAEEVRHLRHLHRQAGLLARLLDVPLEEVARQAMLATEPREWHLRLPDYRDRTVVFDDAVRRDPQGRPELAHHHIEIGPVRIRLALEELSLLDDLPLDDAPRMLFGAAVLDCVREEGGGWVVRFRADSGVLLTDADAAGAVVGPSSRDGLDLVLDRQRRWLDDRGGARLVEQADR